MMMGSKWVWVKLLFSMFVLLANSSSERCWEQERLALLQLKPFFNNPTNLKKWVDGDENSDCCRWERVNCNNNTGRVKQLHLFYTRNTDLGESYLNVSLFTPFEDLEYLDLGGNNIAGCIENEGFEILSRLRKLKVLILNINLFSNNIFSSLKNLPLLRELHLNGNRLEGTINLKGFKRMKSLKKLDLSYNELRELNHINDLSKLKLLDLSGNLFNRSISFLNGLSSLETLRLSSIGFEGTLNIEELGSLSNLKELMMTDNVIDKFFVPKDNKGLRKLNTLKRLSLAYNNFTATIFTQGLCKLVHLQELHIEGNYISGSLPWCLANMTSLQILDVSYNQFTGKISSSPLVHLTFIQELILSGNLLQIPISFEPFFNESKLKKFYGEDNQFYEAVNSDSMTPKFQLNLIRLSGHLDGGTFPKFLHHQHDLQEVGLSHLNLVGEYPNWLLENNTKLETLDLANNSLSGPFWMPSNSHRQIKMIDISSNFFQGHIPVEIGEFLPNLNSLNISVNAFNGSIPSSFGKMKYLRSLDLSDNELNGEIPEHLVGGCLSLQLLVLSSNSLQGNIFPKSFKLTNLLRLQLDDNNFTGEITGSLSNASLLVGLYLSGNHLLGRIPSWLGNLSSLQDIVLPNNHFQGTIPTEFCQLNSLQILDLSENNISGSLPSCFSPSSIKQVHLSKNMLQGQLKDGTFYNSSSLETLDLSYNNFNGSIPNWIDKLSQLTFLIMAGNNLEGEVPFQLCRLNKLRLIDLSRNNLSGQIPYCLDNTSLNEDYSTPATPTSFYDLIRYTGPEMAEEETIRFTTKKISYTYRGRPLDSMFGVDLSCNNLIGSIPSQIGNLSKIRALNLSHNNLTGIIPETFLKLRQIESLDLSYNNLNGKIPPQLVELNTLAVFSVAYNNLSGKTPEWTAQFATFNESSYEGNPFLCGQPLPQSCSSIGSPSPVPTTSSVNREDLIDMDSFYITFVISYIIAFLGIIIILFVNPYWRRRWLYVVETWMISCYYFIVDHLPTKLFC